MTQATQDEQAATALLSPAERNVARQMGIASSAMLRARERDAGPVQAACSGPATDVHGELAMSQPLPAGQAPDWIMVARVGTWRGHPQAAPDPVDITASGLASALAYFERNNAANGVQLVVDYHHASKVAPLVNAPAAGWVDRMEMRANGAELWGHVSEWTAEATAALQERKFRHVSPVLTFNAPDPVTGERVPLSVHSIALTNTPFMRELQALNSADAAGAGQPQDTGDRIMTADEPTGTTGQPPQTVAAAAPSLQDIGVQGTALLNALGTVSGKSPEEISVALGLQAGAGSDAVLSAITSVVNGQRDTEAIELVDAAVVRGAVPPASRTFWLGAARADLNGAMETLNAMPSLIAPSSLANRTADKPGGLTDAEREVGRRFGLTDEQMLAARDA